MDIGAYEYVNLHPPEVTGRHGDSLAEPAGPGQLLHGRRQGGANQTPQTINVTFTQPDRPQLDQRQHGAARGAGRQRQQRSRPTLISLAGKLSYDQRDQHAGHQPGRQRAHPADRRVPADPSGSGSQVIANPQGIALDGENTDQQQRPQPGAQLPLPSGDGYPGRQLLRQLHHQHHPAVGHPGTFKLDPASDTNIVGD